MYVCMYVCMYVTGIYLITYVTLLQTYKHRYLYAPTQPHEDNQVEVQIQLVLLLYLWNVSSQHMNPLNRGLAIDLCLT